MNLDIRTLAFILSLTCITQVIALFLQYIENKTYRGIGWWLLGSISMALGFIFLTLGPIKYIGVIAIFGNPLLILGRVFLFIGTIRFIGKKENSRMVALAFIGFACLYYYFLFIQNNIANRTVIVSASIGLFSILIAYNLFSNSFKNYSGSAKFTAYVFLAHGCYLLTVIAFTLLSKPIQSYVDFSPIQTATFIVPTITSTLWTFGFILMVNQRLSAENLEEKENLQRVFNTSPDAALITRLDDGSFVDANLRFSTMTGYSRAEIHGNSTIGINIWQNPTDRKRFVAELGEKGVSENQEFTFQRKDGTSFVGMISAKTITIDGLPHILSVTRDITELRKIEAEKLELETRNRQLQKAESLGRMAGAIAHHFNNQLQSVMSNLELMSEPAKGINPTKCLTRAKQATERAAEVSRLMLVYLGQTSSELQPSLLAELCRGSLPILQASLPGHALPATGFPFPGPIINADATQIQQVVTNLVANAWEALGETRGTIRLCLKTCLAKDIPATHRFPINWLPQEPEYACLEVSDTGCGIADPDIEKLFDPFFSTKFTGRGLGLPVVLGIVQAHGGVISVESQQGQGSVFRLHFPICAAAAAHPPVTEAHESEFTAHGTLLLVDDDEFLLESTGTMLERIGFTLLTAKDGVEAMEVFRQHRGEIRCVITDLTMPRMDGWETLTALRQLDPGLPVILASGYDTGQVMSGPHPDAPALW